MWSIWITAVVFGKAFGRQELEDKKLQEVSDGFTLYDFESFFPMGPLPKYKQDPTFNEEVDKLQKGHENKFLSQNSSEVCRRILKQKQLFVAISLWLSSMDVRSWSTVPWLTTHVAAEFVRADAPVVASSELRVIKLSVWSFTLSLWALIGLEHFIWLNLTAP